jgi:hypothetical protein
MGEFGGRGWRVLGFYVFLLGSGLVLESRAVWYGVAIMVVGAGCFAWGILSRHKRQGMTS